MGIKTRLKLLFLEFFALAALFAATTNAQECTESDQATQDTCVDSAITTCLDVVTACENRVVTSGDIRILLIESCCCKGGSLASTPEFNSCKKKKRKQFNRAAKIFPTDFRTAVRSVFSDLSAGDCTACDF